MHTSVAVDGAGWPHVAYYNVDWGILEYAFKDDEGWHRFLIDQSISVGRYASLRLDAAERPHIAYYDGTLLDLKYARVLPASLALAAQVEGGTLTLSWSACQSAAEFWVFGAPNSPFFQPGSAPGFEHRLAQLPAGTGTWQTQSGVGDPSADWTYVVMAVTATGVELGRSNRAGELEFEAQLP